MNTNEDKQRLIDYIDHMHSAMIADYATLSTDLNVKQDHFVGHADLLWDLAAVHNTMLCLHSELKQLQNTIRNMDVSKKI